MIDVAQMENCNNDLNHTHPGNRSRFLVKLQLVNPVKVTRTMIEGDNSCLGKIRKDMDKIKIRSRALNTQTKYLTGAYCLKYQHIARIFSSNNFYLILGMLILRIENIIQ